MKSFILSGLSLLVLGSFILPAQATETLTPAQVANLAYQGYLSPSGIDGYNSLVQDLTARKVDGKQVVEAAVSQGRLPETVLQDDHFISSVDNFLNQFVTGNSSL